MSEERRDLIDAAFETSNALLGYAVSTYITSTTDEGEVRELFRRANSSGVKIRQSEVRNLSTTLGIELLAFSEPNLVS